MSREAAGFRHIDGQLIWTGLGQNAEYAAQYLEWNLRCKLDVARMLAENIYAEPGAICVQVESLLHDIKVAMQCIARSMEKGDLNKYYEQESIGLIKQDYIDLQKQAEALKDSVKKEK